MKECTSESGTSKSTQLSNIMAKKHILKGKISYQLQEAQEIQLGKLNNEYT